jgi:hypothetical protein
MLPRIFARHCTHERFCPAADVRNATENGTTAFKIRMSQLNKRYLLRRVCVTSQWRLQALRIAPYSPRTVYWSSPPNSALSRTHGALSVFQFLPPVHDICSGGWQVFNYSRWDCAIAQATHHGGPGSIPGHVGFVADIHWGLFPQGTSISPANLHSINFSTFIDQNIIISSLLGSTALLLGLYLLFRFPNPIHSQLYE